jgi:pimeloyl-ACP methyl ester carboxylesterase
MPSLQSAGVSAGLRTAAADPARRSTLAALQRADRTAPDENALARLELPVLVVCGAEDPALAGARALAEVVPNATLEVLPGQDHLSAVGDPVYKRAVKEFLAQVSPVAGKVAGTR